MQRKKLHLKGDAVHRFFAPHPSTKLTSMAFAADFDSSIANLKWKVPNYQPLMADVNGEGGQRIFR